MTDGIYFDTDCLSSFLWVKAEHILVHLYSGNIKIPQHVQNELTISAIAHLKVRLDVLVNNGDAVIQPIFMNTSEYALYTKLTSAPDKRHIIIGKGEAAAIALAFSSNGIVASNNMKDVAAYVAEFNLRHLTTGSILIKAFEESLITEQDGNQIWSMMLAKRRKIGAATFSDYLHSHIN